MTLLEKISVKFIMFIDFLPGKLSFLRSLRVSNKQLYNVGLTAGLQHLCFSHPFNPLENWLPCCYMVGRSSSNEHIGMSDDNSSSSDQYEIGLSAKIYIIMFCFYTCIFLSLSETFF